MSEGMPAREILTMLGRWADKPHPTEEPWWEDVPPEDRVAMLEAWEGSAGGTAHRLVAEVRETLGDITDRLSGSEVLELMVTLRRPRNDDPSLS